MRTLVTGATGFVGANLTRRLLSEGHEVHILVRQQANFWRLQSVLPDLRTHQIDLQDKEGVTEAVKQIRPDWVLHLAAYGAYSYQTDLSRMIQTNISGTAHLLQACEQLGFETFINSGSSSEYGVKPYAPTEHEWLEPNSYYAVTKAAATHLCTYESHRQSRPITTLRLYSVYGPWEEPGRLMPTLLRYGFDKHYPPLVSPETARDFIYIDDVLDAYSAVLHSRSLPLGAIYNIGSGKQTQMREVVQVVGKLLKIDEKPIWSTMPQRIWDSNIWIANIARAHHELSWNPQITLEEGLEKMAAWLRLHTDPYPLQNS